MEKLSAGRELINGLKNGSLKKK